MLWFWSLCILRYMTLVPDLQGISSQMAVSVVFILGVYISCNTDVGSEGFGTAKCRSICLWPRRTVYICRLLKLLLNNLGSSQQCNRLLGQA